MEDARHLLPEGMIVLERGWLSSNMALLCTDQEVAIVDTGYWTHAAQTLELVARVVGSRRLATLVNTHLHSDHCGGNAALQERYPDLQTWIPPGLAAAVRAWDPVALSYEPTGQFCPPFRFDGLLEPGNSILLAETPWQVHCAPGHDPHSVILFEPVSRTLLSADALWQNGFGIVFEELEGGRGFDEVAATLELIEHLAPHVVVPGHGPVFSDVAAALDRAHSRLAAYVAAPQRHAAHAAKVLLKYKLLEWQRAPLDDFIAWAEGAPYFRLLHDHWFRSIDLRVWLFALIAELVKSGAAASGTDFVANA